MTDTRDRMLARLEAARARGKVCDYFFLDDIQQLIDENAQFEADVLDLVADQNARAGL